MDTINGTNAIIKIIKTSTAVKKLLNKKRFNFTRRDEPLKINPKINEQPAANKPNKIVFNIPDILVNTLFIIIP